MATVATIIKKRREELGISQKELAARLGLKASQYLSNVERGVARLSPIYFKKISRVLKVPLEKLVNTEVREYRALIGQQAGMSN